MTEAKMAIAGVTGLALGVGGTLLVVNIATPKEVKEFAKAFEYAKQVKNAEEKLAKMKEASKLPA